MAAAHSEALKNTAEFGGHIFQSSKIAGMGRRAIPLDVETSVLFNSARRCPLCFHLNGDLAEKKGQIAHLDQDSSNPAEDNLAFMCLDHHDEYDSKSSQRKNFTEREAKAARTKLYEAIAARQHFPESQRGNATWEIRYRGGLADIAAFPESSGALKRLAVAESIVIVNPSARNVSLRVILLMQHGTTQLAADPASMPSEKWDHILERFDFRSKPLLSFPLTLAAGSSVEGHIAFPVPPDGAGKGIGGDVPEQRRYTLEFEDVLSTEKRVVTASAVYAPDPENHRRVSFTDLTRPLSQVIHRAGWSHFNSQRTIDSGGQHLYENLIPDNFVAFTVPAPCSMLKIVTAITERSTNPIPIDSMSDELAQPVLPRGKVLFGSTGDCIEQVVDNYSQMEWWFTSKGLTISRRL